MNEAPTTDRTEESVEAVLRDHLARGDSVLADARPILRHLIANDDHGLFSDETIARIRGMLLDLAAQLLLAEAAATLARDPAAYVAEHGEELARVLAEDPAFLAYAHTLALEARLTERLEADDGIDPVLPPLVQELVAGLDPDVAELAMAVLAAQARFVQHCRRMALPLRELPGDLFHQALLVLRGRDAGEVAERQLREGYDEGASRLGLIDRLVIGLGDKSAATLQVDHAGPAIFASALALASHQGRDRVVLSFAEGQFARFALALRAAGLSQQEAERQFLFLHPELSPPEGLDALAADRAASLLAAGD